MKKLLRYPFILLLVLTMAVASPFLWKEMGLVDALKSVYLPPSEDPTPQIAELPSLDPLPDPLPAESDPAPAGPADPASGPDQASEENDPALPEPSPDPAPEPDPEPLPEPDPEPQPPAKPENPFENALFIGDSRTVGIAKYSGITEADFFCTTGMDVYSVRKKESSIGDWEKGTLLEDILTDHQYDRIFIMLGINELGYNLEWTSGAYGDLLNWIRGLQPDAYLIVQANLHVGKKRSDTDKVINNPRICQLNDYLAAYADGSTVFYLDVNPIFCDEDGNLISSYTFDDTHPYGKYYALWADWLRENTP